MNNIISEREIKDQERMRVKREKEFEKSQICKKRKETYTVFLCAPPKILRAPPFSCFLDETDIWQNWAWA
jgi:hypothetical protein